MLEFFKNLFKKRTLVNNPVEEFPNISTEKQIKKIAFIDGDQPLNLSLEAYEKYVEHGTETHLVMMLQEGANPPKILKKYKFPNLITAYLQGYTAGKEATDKYITGLIQKAVVDGFNHITVISSDYDFIDIFKMISQINPDMEHITMRLIVPNPHGRLAQIPNNVANVEVIKMSNKSKKG